MKIPDTFQEAMDYFDTHVFYEPAAMRAKYLKQVGLKFGLTARPNTTNTGDE